jgi:hypothetical protein
MPSSIPLFETLRGIGTPHPVGQNRLGVFQYHSWERSPNDVIKLLQTLGSRARLVCDSSAFRRDRPELARALLAHGPVLISPWALPELGALRGDPSAAELCRVLFQANGRLVNDLVPAFHAPELAPAVRYYGDLLSRRKRLLTGDASAANKSSVPSMTCADLAATFGPRAAQLAKKFADKPQRGFADEDAVLLAVFTAFTEQRDVVLVTDDLDVHEQFYKLTSLLQDDIASDRLAADVLRAPERYGPKLPLATFPELAFLVDDVGASFLRKRPGNLDYLFAETRNTRAIYVARVRENSESLVWIGTDDFLEFMKNKVATGRNTSHAGALNVYINAPVLQPSGLPPALYAWFLADRYVPRSPAMDSRRKNVPSVHPPSIVDLARALSDGEHVDTGQFAPRAYAAVVTAHRGGDKEQALGWLRRMERRGRRKDGGVSAGVDIRHGRGVMRRQATRTWTQSRPRGCRTDRTGSQLEG